MQYLKISPNQYCLRLDVNDEVVESIKSFCKQLKITGGCFSGIGATNNVSLGIFDEHTKKYTMHSYKKSLEITSLNGNISTFNNEPYIHTHINLSDHSLKVFGGHLNQAVISVTAEIFITKCNKKLVRQFDKRVGINLLKF
jgi:predicted DNA-binding protein with PD1-like motif